MQMPNCSSLGYALYTYSLRITAINVAYHSCLAGFYIRHKISSLNFVIITESDISSYFIYVR